MVQHQQRCPLTNHITIFPCHDRVEDASSCWTELQVDLSQWQAAGSVARSMILIKLNSIKTQNFNVGLAAATEGAVARLEDRPSSVVSV